MPQNNTKIDTKNMSIYNPWYQDSNFLFKEKDFSQRKQFFTAKNYLEKELILSLIGLRRVGKTTIIRQLINFLLTEKTKPNKIFFYQFDEENVSLEENLDFYFRNILKEDLYKTKCYIFLDELQFVKNWQVVLKKYYDINPKIKFIISGSTHLYLHKNTKESLAGRIIDIKINPFSWHEFINFKYKKNFNFLKNIFADNFLEVVKENNNLLLYKNDFLTFLSYGEYPYFFHEVNAFEMDKYFKEAILDKIFSKDIDLFDIENKKAFQSLFKILSRDSAQAIKPQNIARDIGLSVITIKRHIEILEKMFLYSYISKFDKNLRRQTGSFKKGYVNSLNLTRAALNIDYWDIYSDHFGHIVETFVYNELLRNNIEDITFYHDTKIKKEVDFVLSKGSRIVPIEVKTKNKINTAQFKNLVYFMKNNKLKRGILIYGGDKIEIKKFGELRIECLPYFII